MKNFIERAIVHARAVKRLTLWHCFSKRLPVFMVMEFPKSGGTWFSQMLSECLELPFQRNSTTPRIEKCVSSGHHLYSPNFHNVTLVIRDGRDVMVSAYYYMLFKNEINKQFGVDRHRRDLQFEDYDDIQSNLPIFIEYMFEKYAAKRFHFSWSEFVDSWIDRGFPIVRYEDLLTNAADELIRVIKVHTDIDLEKGRADEVVEKYSFKNMSGRKSGNENKKSFVRKGIAGDWKNNFSSEACKVFDKYAGIQLVRAGYETDRNWVNDEHKF